MSNGKAEPIPGSKPKATAAQEPKRQHPRARKLQELYHTVGQILALESANKSSKVVVDGDLEIPFPDSVKAQVRERIKTRMAEAIGLLKELQNDGE